ncbi:MAG TPA: molybdopterin-dependent oxidoreductase [Candidatus Limnocylindria bacterium]|nr:molybdopterin-dependent oxidoreductase [Candidatus Limnocylindria bacterium]
MTASRLVTRLDDPFNAGAPLDVLGRSYLTPVDAFYVRNHGPVPLLRAADHRLEVDGLVREPISLGQAELAARLPRHELVATLACAGNRRAELSRIQPTPSPLQWGADAVSTGRWSGFRLADLLEWIGIGEGARHVAFEGADQALTGAGPTSFGASIPIDKALGEEVLLADRLNGEPLTPEHGAPLRAVVPGYIGARSVKWLRRVTLLRDPSDNWFQARDYRRDGRALGELELNSAITEPADGAAVQARPVEVRGYAYGGPAERVARVELSADGGACWQSARLLDEGPGEAWAWRLFAASVVLGPGEHVLAVRAWGEHGSTQPPDAATLWNEGGYMNNAWHRVRLTVTA